MLAIKPGAKISGLKPEILLGVYIIEQILEALGFDTVITEGTGGVHMVGSLHYKGLAVDIRSKDITSGNTKVNVIKEGKLSLGEDFDFILEYEGQPNEHFHLEFQPKG